MALVGNLTVGLSVATGAFSKGLKAARGQLSEFASGVGGLVGKFGGLTAAITGFVGAASITALVANSMSAIDELGAAADKLGTTSEALSGLRFAASQSDVEIETLQGGLQKLNAKLGKRRVRIAVLTPSPLARAAGTAVHWFRPEVCVFGPSNVDSAMAHLDVSPELARQLKDVLKDLMKEVGVSPP